MVSQAIATIQKRARNSAIGDRQILILTLEDVVRIRTGELGQDAI
jgi:nitrogen regulatory protein PII